MQDADVPMWDKGDSTDDYSKSGGGTSFLFDAEDKSEKASVVTDLYELILGRKPTSRELAYYRYSPLKQEELIKKLLKGTEHKDTIRKGRDYPDLEEREKLDQSTIMKLKHSIEDQQEEVNNMKLMLEEKNKEIAILRDKKDTTFVTQSFLEGKSSVPHYGTTEKKEVTKQPNSFIDKLFYFIQNLSK